METAAAAARKGVGRYPRRWLAALVMTGAATMDLIDLTIAAALPSLALPGTAVDPSAVFVADVDSEVAEL